MEEEHCALTNNELQNTVSKEQLFISQQFSNIKSQKDVFMQTVARFL